MPAPLLSVIVPAHNAAALLPVTLGALARSDLPRAQWELIVVDDASRDATSQIAAGFADQVLTLAGSPHGPGYARNRGVEASRGAWVVFLDADVVAHTDTLSRFVDAFAATPPIDACFGAYDATPAAPGFVSQYRNLLHRYVHLAGAGPAETFWAGCGAVRRSAFVAVGGFDERRYSRPKIEDIELGYRLRDAGGRIQIRPEIEGTHLKRWTLRSAIRTDLLDRGIPWVRLLLERRRSASQAHLNVTLAERAKTALVGSGLALLLFGLLTRRSWAVAGGGLALLAVLLWNLPMLTWFGRQRGPLFALAVVPMNLLYYVLNGVAVAVGTALQLADGSRPPAGRVASSLGLGALPDGTRTRRNQTP